MNPHGHGTDVVYAECWACW